MTHHKAKHLYIIGNGFDLHHHIPSNYSDFKEWLKENDIDTLCKIEEILAKNNYREVNNVKKIR